MRVKLISLRACLLSILLSFSQICFAQVKQFQHITSANGISQSEIYSFLEDSRGFMWFGTVDGLNRYDGYQMMIFNTDKDSPNSISNNTIRCLAEDNIGRIWIGTDNGLCVYDSRLEKIYQLQLKGYDKRRLTVNAAIINDGKLYVATSLGLLMLNVRSENYEQIEQSVNFIKISDYDGAYNAIACILGKEGYIWLVTSMNLYQLDVKDQSSNRQLSKVLDMESLLPNPRNLAEDPFGNLWVVSQNNGVVRFNPQSRALKHFKKAVGDNGFLSDNISSVVVDKAGNLWIGTRDKGLIWLERQYLNEDDPVFQLIEHDPYNDRSLNSNLIYSLFVSRSNLLWIGTIGSGINIYDPNRKPFYYYNLHSTANQASYSTNFVRAVYADQEDNIWLGTHNNGLYYFDRTNDQGIRKLGFGTESVFHLNNARDGMTFVCTESGISLVRRINNSLQVLSTLSIGPTFYTTPPEDDIFWVASLYGVKKCRLANDKIIIEKELSTESAPPLSFDNCRVLYFSKKTNELFIGTEGGGLNVLHLNNKMEPIRTAIYVKGDSTNTLSNNYIRSIIKSTKNDLWIGTYEGLNKMKIDAADNSISFQSFTTKNGLPNNTIQSIIEDDQHNLWIGTNQGLCKFAPDMETFTQYTINDGMQSNEFSEHTIFKKPDNEIIIGGINGINTFYPEQITASDISPNIILTDFYLFNKQIGVGEKTADFEYAPLKESISLTDSIFLEPSQNSIGFEFSAMIFNSPEKIQYAYMLEGFDKEWNYTDASDRKANYTNLSFGDYVFKVKATNNDGLWEETPKTVFVSIKTPFYYTTSAFVLYGLLAILSFVFFTNYSILRYTTKNKILLENQHNKKVRELEELRTRFFINVSHDLRTPLTLISAPLDIIMKNNGVPTEVKDLLHLMRRNVQKLKDMTEQLLDIRKVEAGRLFPKLNNQDIVSFVRKEVSFFENAYKEKGIAIEVSSDEDFYSLSFDADMISKVLFNMTSNALKHTQQGKVTIHLSKASQPVQENKETPGQNVDFIKITIEDTGDGIEEADLPMIFERFYQGKKQNKKGYGIGLSHSKDLVEAHQGRIEVSSTKGVGTSFSIYLPISTNLATLEQEPPAVIDHKSISESAKSEPSVVAEDQKEEITDASKKTKILLVEDNLDLQHFISKQLSKAYNVLTASNGIEGLDIANEHFPDLVVSDVMMPNMDGMEFCKILKSDIKTSHIPVILLTAKVDKEAKYQGLEIGADDYISKPFEMEHLLLRIKNLLKNRERLRKIFQGNISLEPAKITVTSIDEKFLSDLMAKIEEGIPEADFSITTLEQELGMSHSSFYNKIKSLTGQSAKELVFNMRMKRAKQILEDTANIRVSEVAYMVGFTDPKYFSKRFKEYFGATPSDFTKTS